MWTLKKKKNILWPFYIFQLFKLYYVNSDRAICYCSSSTCVIYYVNCADLSHVGQKITWGTNITLILQITLYFLRLTIWCIRDKNWQVLPIGLQHLHLFWFKSSVTKFSYNASLTVWKTHVESHGEKFHGIVLCRPGKVIFFFWFCSVLNI